MTLNKTMDVLELNHLALLEKCQILINNTDDHV